MVVGWSSRCLLVLAPLVRSSGSDPTNHSLDSRPSLRIGHCEPRSRFVGALRRCVGTSAGAAHERCVRSPASGAVDRTHPHLPCDFDAVRRRASHTSPHPGCGRPPLEVPKSHATLTTAAEPGTGSRRAPAIREQDSEPRACERRESAERIAGSEPEDRPSAARPCNRTDRTHRLRREGAGTRPTHGVSR